jgi:hypothetical protein
MKPTPEQEAQLAELPFAVLALTLASDTNLHEEEIAAAQRGLNTLDIGELMSAVSATEHSPTELFEMAWLEDDPRETIANRAALLSSVFGPARARMLCEELALLSRLVGAASDRPLRGRDRLAYVVAAERALGVSPS